MRNSQGIMKKNEYWKYICIISMMDLYWLVENSKVFY